MRWGGICKPPCPTCKSDKDVSRYLPQPQIVSTDNPSRDNNHLMETFKSLRDQKDEFNKGSTATHGTKTATYPYDDKFVKIVTSQSDICAAVSAMDMIMNKEKGMALDCEWRVQFYGHGKKNESKVGLIQLAFSTKNKTTGSNIF